MRRRAGPPGRLGRAIAAALFILTAQAARADPANLVERGEYLAIASDCTACHTAPGGQPMAGGLAMATPMGAIVSSNITPSRTHGIGGYTFAQFDLALRRGVRADGAPLYPAMPYTAYAKLSDADTRALYDYFMNGVAPAEVTPRQTRLPFPFNIRQLMLAWNLLFLDKRPFTPDPARGADWNRGAYLVQGPAHCGACHTPRNWMMAEESGRALAGASLAGWFAPNITSDPVSGVGGWSLDELVDYMRSGHAAGKAQAAGPMAEAVDDSLRSLDPADLRAIAVYLKSTTPVRDATDSRPAFAWGQPGDDLASIRGVPLPSDLDQMTGPQLYDAHCSTCHQARGEGSFDGALPSLFHNTAVGNSRPDNLAMVILGGIRRLPDVNMPAFGNRMSDIQIATLTNYLTGRWGNPHSRITATQVAALRSGGPASPLLWLAQAGLIALGVVVIGGGWLAFRRSRAKRRD